MSNDEAYAYTMAAPTPTPTIEEMAEIIKGLDLPECWHWDLITDECLPKSASGVTYMCIKCYKLFTVPNTLFKSSEPPTCISTFNVGGIA